MSWYQPLTSDVLVFSGVYFDPNQFTEAEAKHQSRERDPIFVNTDKSNHNNSADSPPVSKSPKKRVQKRQQTQSLAPNLDSFSEEDDNVAFRPAAPPPQVPVTKQQAKQPAAQTKQPAASSSAVTVNWRGTLQGIIENAILPNPEMLALDWNDENSISQTIPKQKFLDWMCAHLKSSREEAKQDPIENSKLQEQLLTRITDKIWNVQMLPDFCKNVRLRLQE